MDICIKIENTKDAPKKILPTLKKYKNNFMLYNIIQEKAIAQSNQYPIDIKLAKELGYKIYNIHHSGGAIVSNPGDLAIVYFGEKNFKEDFSFYFLDYLNNEKKLNATKNNNDFLIDGYKIASMSIRQIPLQKFSYNALFIGVNTNVEEVLKICTQKPTVKIPKGLSEYGITTEEIETLVLNFFKEY